MVVALDEGLAFEFSMLVLAISEADDLVKLGSALVFVHVDAIAKTNLFHRYLHRVEIGTESKRFGHRRIELVQHLVEVVAFASFVAVVVLPADMVPILVELLANVVDYLPPVDDIDAVVTLIAKVAVPVDTER